MFSVFDFAKDPNIRGFSLEEEDELNLPSFYVALKKSQKAFGEECPEKIVTLKKGTVGLRHNIYLNTKTNTLFCSVDFEYQMEPFCTDVDNREILLGTGIYKFEDLVFLTYNYKLIEKNEKRIEK